LTFDVHGPPRLWLVPVHHPLVGTEPLTLLIVSWYSWCNFCTNLSVSVNQ